MDRRTVITGSALGVSLASVGCLGGLQGGSGAESDIEAGVQSLSKAAMVLETYEQQSVGEGAVFDTAQVTTHTDAARNDFEDARADASGDQQTLLTNLGYLADMMDGLAAVYEAVDQVLADLETVGQLANSERFDQANTQLGETSTNVETVRSNVQTVTTTAERIDDSIYQEFEEIDRAAFESWGTEMDAWVKGIEFLIGGYDPFLDGMVAFDTGEKRLQASEYDTAETHFTDAKDQFDEALDEFRSGKRQGPAELEPDFVALACKQEAFRDGMGHYAEAARAAGNGDQSAFDTALETANDTVDSDC
jgi:hypothetical protein